MGKLSGEAFLGSFCGESSWKNLCGESLLKISGTLETLAAKFMNKKVSLKSLWGISVENRCGESFWESFGGIFLEKPLWGILVENLFVESFWGICLEKSI